MTLSIAKKPSRETTRNLITLLLVTVAFVAVSLMSGAGMLTRSFKGQLVPICVYIVMAVSLNLTVGVSGDLSLGHAGFMSVGAFTGVVAAACMKASVPDPVVRLVLSMVIGGVFAGLAGVVVGVPVLRLSGDYLAIVTLAFGEIIRNVINCLYVSLDDGVLRIGMNNPDLAGKMLINGPQGAQGIQKLATFAIGFGLVMFTLIVIMNLINSRTGRAIMAIRDNRIAAEAIGISVTRYKLTAFVTSAVFAGMAGTLYAMNFSTVTAGKFKFDTSILVLVFVVLGGIGSIRGSIIAAALLTVLPEMLRSFSDYRMLIYAVVLIFVMLATNNARLRFMVITLRNKLHAARQAKGGGKK